MRRAFWIALGLGAGAAGAIIASRWTRKQAQRVKPQTLAREAKAGLFDLTRLVAESIEEGKRAMDERERDLREQHDVPQRSGDDAPTVPPAA